MGRAGRTNHGGRLKRVQRSHSSAVESVATTINVNFRRNRRCQFGQHEPSKVPEIVGIYCRVRRTTDFTTSVKHAELGICSALEGLLRPNPFFLVRICNSPGRSSIWKSPTSSQLGLISAPARDFMVTKHEERICTGRLDQSAKTRRDCDARTVDLARVHTKDELK